MTKRMIDPPNFWCKTFACPTTFLYKDHPRVFFCSLQIDPPYYTAIASTIAFVTFLFPFLSFGFFSVRHSIKLQTFWHLPQFDWRRVEINRQIIIKLPSIWISVPSTFFDHIMTWHIFKWSFFRQFLFFHWATNEFDLKSMLICCWITRIKSLEFMEFSHKIS